MTELHPAYRHDFLNKYANVNTTIPGFEEVCDAWINYTGPVNTVYNWNMNNVNGKDWSSLGKITWNSED
jgi:hypothetical protein